MSDIRLLDCTLRDGGFINDWDFGHETIINVFERSASAGVDIIEIGFIDERREFDENRTILPDAAAVNSIFEGLDHKEAMVVGMIDYGTCSINRIIPCKDSIMDGIRVIFKKKDCRAAIDFCAKLKALGYLVFVQPVSITGYSDDEMLSLVRLVNELSPYAMSMVDTYGLLHEGGLLHYFELMNEHLDEAIALGYHAHNNFQLGYSNSIALLERHRVSDSGRTLVIDGSAFGMGKGAGNTPLELLAMYMNNHFGKNYDISQILEAIDVSIMKIYAESPWGYSMNYFLAASNDCHPKYVQHLVDKRTLSVKSVNEILSEIDSKEKLAYNETHIEDLYREHQANSINDSATRDVLKKLLGGCTILLIGPGSTISTHEPEIKKYIEKEKPVIITINYSPELCETDYIFVTNAKRYVSLEGQLLRKERSPKLIATSNVTRANGSFDYTLDYSSLIDKEASIPDSSLIMLLNLLSDIGIEEVNLAGFDGYSARPEANYFNLQMEYTFVKNRSEELNLYMKSKLSELGKIIKINYVTPSFYDK